VSIGDLIDQAISLHERLGLFSLPPLEERSLIDSVLPFAHEAASLRERVIVEHHLCRLRLSHDAPPPEALFDLYAAPPKGPRRTDSDNNLRKSLDDWWSSVAEDRHIFRWALELIAKSPKAARAELTPAFEDAIKRICVIPKLQWDGEKTLLTHYLAASRSDAIWYYVLMLLMDERKGFRRLLRTCRYSECGRFFLSSATSRSYCSTVHQLLGEKEKNAERQKRLRDRQKAKARKPK
jgi:hypothetical protein